MSFENAWVTGSTKIVWWYQLVQYSTVLYYAALLLVVLASTSTRYYVVSVDSVLVLVLGQASTSAGTGVVLPGATGTASLLQPTGTSTGSSIISTS
jgi:hypothetical protein